MAELITMPKLGFDMAEGKLGEWLKKAGDTVTQGETILLVETDKASVEVPAFRSGVLLKILVAAGESVPIGTPIAAIGEAGETVEAEVKAKVEVKAEAKIEAKAEVRPRSSPRLRLRGRTGGWRLRRWRCGWPPSWASTCARWPGADRAAGSSSATSRLTSRRTPRNRRRRRLAHRRPCPIPSYEPTAEGYRVEPLSGMRQTIARRMVDSKQQAPHFYVTTEIDMAPAMALRGQLNALLPEAEKISVNDLIVKAAALTLRQFPGINASFAADGIHIHDHVHVGVAVARENGLVTAVLRDCDKTSLALLAIQTRELVGRTREGRMKPDDMMGATFTISNLGMFDVEEFSAIITMPQAAALAVGAVKKIPVVNADGQLAVGTRMKVTLSADHRVTDGAEVAKFLQALKAALEQPLRLVL